MSKKQEKAANISTEEISEYKPFLGKILNIVAVLLAVILILVIYLPTVIWNEEAKLQKLGRKRMNILNKVENYLYTMDEMYVNDPVTAMKLLSAVRDSTRADSNYFGEKLIRLSDGNFEVNVVRNFFQSFDTTFALTYQKRDTVIDSIYKVLKWNEIARDLDTVYLSAIALKNAEYDSILAIEANERVESNNYYLQYYLEDKIAFRPITGEKYKVEVQSDTLKILDPIDYIYKEPRFLVFSLKDSTHGYIEKNEVSW